MSQTTDRFSELIHGLFYDIIKQSSVITPTVKQIENMRTISNKLAKTLEHRVREVAIEVVKKLQEGISEGFNLIEKDINNLTKRIKELENEIKKEQ